MSTPSGRRQRMPVGAALLVGILLLIPCVALALVPTYSRTSPTLWGWPFFYWYQVLWVFVTPALTYSAYLIIKKTRGDR